MTKTLISKLGALGDVVRTTVLLEDLSKQYDEIHWLTSKSSKDLLNSKKIHRVYLFENNEDKSKIIDNEFDLLLSLDEEKEPLEFLKNVKAKKLIGHFLNPETESGIDYTPECNYWLNMSFISKTLSREDADKFKLRNEKSVPEIFIEMIFGENSWRGQEYDIGVEPKPLKEVKGKIGLIDVTESKWPDKYWRGYNSLKEKLIQEGYQVVSLGMRETLQEHIDDINGCETIVCGDTLGMHLALALKKKVVSIFNCTPPNEIYHYRRMKQIISPYLNKYFLKRTNDEEAQNAISVDEVYNAVKEALG